MLQAAYPRSVVFQAAYPQSVVLQATDMEDYLAKQLHHYVEICIIIHMYVGLGYLRGVVRTYLGKHSRLYFISVI